MLCSSTPKTKLNPRAPTAKKAKTTKEAAKKRTKASGQDDADDKPRKRRKLGSSLKDEADTKPEKRQKLKSGSIEAKETAITGAIEDTSYEPGNVKEESEDGTELDLISKSQTEPKPEPASSDVSIQKQNKSKSLFHAKLEEYIKTEDEMKSKIDPRLEAESTAGSDLKLEKKEIKTEDDDYSKPNVVPKQQQEEISPKQEEDTHSKPKIDSPPQQDAMSLERITDSARVLRDEYVELDEIQSYGRDLLHPEVLYKLG